MTRAVRATASHQVRVQLISHGGVAGRVPPLLRLPSEQLEAQLAVHHRRQSQVLALALLLVRQRAHLRREQRRGLQIAACPPSVENQIQIPVSMLDIYEVTRTAAEEGAAAALREGAKAPGCARRPQSCCSR